MSKPTVLVLFGGRSPEHEVSLVSARSVISNIPREQFCIVTVGITKKGVWYLTEAEADAIADGSWERSPQNRRAALSPVYREGLLVFGENGVFTMPVDVVFPVLHGENGEDGTIQGLFALSGIPFVGPGVRASADCMDKITAKRLLAEAGIPVADGEPLLLHQYRANPAAMVERIERRLGYPVFIKPSGAGSSVGISKVKRREELLAALDLAFRYDSRALAEEAVVGREVEVAVLGTAADPLASTCGEIVPANEFYDYEAKYIRDSELHVPARISEEKAAKVREYACRAFATLDCHGMSRVDFFVCEDRILLNEVNTIPGFTPISMYPRLFAHDGIPYPELLKRLITLALER